MRRAGRVVRAALDAAAAACVDGATTFDVNASAEAAIRRCAERLGTDVRPLFLNYPTYVAGEGFPAVTCVSVNEELVHGVPGRRVLRRGDVVSIDCGASVDGWCADSAITVAIEPIADASRSLLETTRRVLDVAIEMVRPGRRWSEIAGCMQRLAEEAGLGVVRDYVGHGIGRRLHEAPEVPGFVDPEREQRDFTLRPGMTLAIEPMLVLGRAATIEGDDGWTVSTADRLASAHFEHTIAVTRDGADILTDGR